MRWALAWALYWIGDGIWQLMRLADPLSVILYRLYSRAMAASSWVQGPSGRGPWSAVEASP